MTAEEREELIGDIMETLFDPRPDAELIHALTDGSGFVEALDRYADAVAAPLVALLRSCERELWLGGSVVQMRERIRATLEAYEEAAR